MALDSLPEGSAAIMKRAEAFPTGPASHSLEAALQVAGCKKDIRLLRPVTKKQQRLQDTAIRDVLAADNLPVLVSLKACHSLQAFQTDVGKP